MRMKWVIEDGMAFPACPRCGAYPLTFYGRVEHLGYLLLCDRCGIAVRRKTHPNTLAMKALDRRWRK